MYKKFREPGIHNNIAEEDHVSTDLEERRPGAHEQRQCGLFLSSKMFLMLELIRHDEKAHKPDPRRLDSDLAESATTWLARRVQSLAYLPLLVAVENADGGDEDRPADLGSAAQAENGITDGDRELNKYQQNGKIFFYLEQDVPMACSIYSLSIPLASVSSSTAFLALLLQPSSQ
jgi:hypothetical protein